MACMFHGEDSASRGRLYVNCDPGAEILGLYECKVCDAHGALPTIQKFYGDQPVEEGDENSEIRLEILRVAAAYYHQALGDSPEAFAYLRGSERNLSTDTIIVHQVGYASDEIEQDLGEGTIKKLPSRALYRHLRDLNFTTSDILSTGLVTENRDKKLIDSLSGMITIPYKIAGNVVQIRGRSWPYQDTDPKPKYKTCGGNSTRLFNSDAVWDNTEIIVTEGEFDAMILSQYGFANVVGAPGAKSWQDAWDGYVNQMRRIWLVFDRDPAGEQGAVKIVDKFGAKVRRIHLSPEGSKCDPTQWFGQGNTTHDFQSLIDAAKRGGLIVTVADAIEEHREYQGQPGLKLGTELLDMGISPGLHPSQVMVILAKTGTGKTIKLLNTMQRMRMVDGQEDLKFLFLSLEQTRGEWWERARRIHRFYNLDSNEEECADWWHDNIAIVDRNRLTRDDIYATVDDFDYRFGRLPDVLMIDYLGYWARSFRAVSKYEQVSEAIMTVKEMAKDMRKPVIIPHQVSRVAKEGEEFGTDAARDSGAIEETADFLLTLWSPDNNLGRQESEKQGIVKERVGKSRHGGRGLLVDYRWAPLSLVMVPMGEARLEQLAKDEMVYASPGFRDDWETAVWRHRTGFKGATQKPGSTYEQDDF